MLNVFLEDPTIEPGSQTTAAAVAAIQLWWKKYTVTKSVLSKLKSVNGKIILKALNCNPSDFDSFETAHELVFNEGFFKEISKFVAAAYFSLTEGNANDSKSPLSPTAVQREKMAEFRTMRIIASSVIISKYPQDMLSDGGEVASQGIETLTCLTTAHLLIKAIRNVLVLVSSSQPGHKRVYERLMESQFATQSFLSAFAEWKRVDSVRILKAVEGSFVESYSMLLSVVGAVRAGDASAGGMVTLYEGQVRKIKDTMVKILGESQAINRIEELCAAIEASMPTSIPTPTTNTTADASGSSSSSSSSSNKMDFSKLLNNPNHSSPRDADTPSSPSSSSSRPSSPRQRAKVSMHGILTAARAMTIAGGDSDDSTTMSQSLKMLDKLSQMAGIENERLAYEIRYDKFFALPGKPTTEVSRFPLMETISEDSFTTGPINEGGRSILSAPSVMQILRMKMLRLIGDKLVNAMLPSEGAPPLSASSLTPALEMYLHRNVLVKFQPSSSSATTPITPASPPAPILTAKIIAIHCSNSVVSSTHAVERVASSELDEEEDLAQALELSMDVTVGSQVPASAPLSPPPVQHPIFFDVLYLADGTREEGVSADRLKTSADIPDATLFLQLLDDLCRQIASLVPNRPDIRAQIYQPLDFELLQQMIEKSAITPTRDILPLLVHLVQKIKDLQAPSRVEGMVAWLNDFFSQWYYPMPNIPSPPPTPSSSVGSTNDDDKSPPPAPEAPPSRSRSFIGEPLPFSAIIPLLPAFFEKANDFIEQIQRDLANFYVGTLAPVMASPAGKEFLKQRFMQRVEGGLVSLDATASLFMAQIAPSSSPTEGLPGTLAELSDAGLSPADLTLSCIRDQEPAARAVACRALLALLQIPLRIDGPQARALKLVPEPLEWDATRLATARDSIDRIALESSLVIAARQLLAPYRVMSVEADEIELQIRLDVLLSDGKETNMATISAEVEKYLTHAILRARESSAASTSPRVVYDAKELREKAEKCVKDTISPGNAVLNLLTKRVYKVVLRALLKQPYMHKLPSFSLSSKAQERNWKSVLDAICGVFNHNWQIHSALYCSVLAALFDSLATMGSPDDSPGEHSA